MLDYPLEGREFASGSLLNELFDFVSPEPGFPTSLYLLALTPWTVCLCLKRVTFHPERVSL